MAFKRPSRGFRAFVMRSNPLESRADRGMRGYVTGGGPVTTRAKRDGVRATASRHVVWRARWLAAHSRREGLCARTAGRRRSRGRARVKAGDACAVLQAPRLLRWQRSSRGWRDGPRRFDGDARNSTRTDSRAAPAILRLHLDASVPRWRGIATSLQTLLASTTEAT